MLAGLSAFTINPAAAQRRWYMLNLHGEACVPLDHISVHAQRLNDASGPLRTPDDMVNLMRALGMQIEISTRNRPGLFMFGIQPTLTQGNPSFIALVNNRALCLVLSKQ